MTVNNSRSLRGSLINGSTDGKYRKRRPDTEIAAGMGDSIIEENRDSLDPMQNYGFINSEAMNKVSPGTA